LLLYSSGSQHFQPCQPSSSSLPVIYELQLNYQPARDKQEHEQEQIKKLKSNKMLKYAKIKN